MKLKLLSGLAGLALALGTAGPVPAAAPSAQAQPALAWKDFTQQTIDRWFALDPASAVYQGAHQYDGKLPDWSDAGLKTRADFLRSVIADARAYTGLSAADAFERDYLIQVDPSNPDLLLGKAYFAIGPARIGGLNYFILERHRRGLTDYAKR